MQSVVLKIAKIDSELRGLSGFNITLGALCPSAVGETCPLTLSNRLYT